MRHDFFTDFARYWHSRELSNLGGGWTMVSLSKGFVRASAP